MIVREFIQADNFTCTLTPFELVERHEDSTGRSQSQDSVRDSKVVIERLEPSV